MFESRRRSSGSANRWLIVAGAGLVILAFVARMLLDIGQTKVSDLAAAIRPDTVDSPGAPPRVPPPIATSTSSTRPPGTRVVVADPPPVLKMDTSGAGGLYQVQIGAFGSEANATKLRQQALAIGYGAVVVPQPRNGTTLYLVRVKGLTSAGEAQQVSASLARRLGVQSVVVPPARQDR